ncbi:MAG: DUF4240 domain-containing protein [Chitinophagaceae bacterium]|nr:MAG: DUF4240 domain-containing protein [Chitinophagaceae bacterium]
MDLEKFWDLIEGSWQDAEDANKKRLSAIKTNDQGDLEALADEIEDNVLTTYEDRLYELEKNELTGFIHILEERLYNIDRAEIHEYTDGSDDGFLYVRCYIVAMGRAYYDMIDKDPKKATPDVEAEGFGFTAYSVYADRFDEDFRRGSKHNIETGSNAKGWPGK